MWRPAVLLLLVFLCFPLTGCEKSPAEVRIGVSLGVDTGGRWITELQHMHDRAKELGITLDSRLSTADTPYEQQRHCRELFDEGIDVLIVTSRQYESLKLLYAEAVRRGIKIVCYSRMPLGYGSADFFVGFDNYLAGMAMGQFLDELAPAGDYIVFRGHGDDSDARDIYEGAIEALPQYGNAKRILCDTTILKWLPDVAYDIVYTTVQKNGGRIDAILAPDNHIAEACRMALDELGITEKVAITGFGTDLDSVRRVRAGRQSMTIHADYKLLAYTAVDQALNLALGKTPKSNKRYSLDGDRKVDAMLVPCQVITPLNIDSRLIESGIYTHDQVYGTEDR